ncbi:MAG: NUDIX domain-containing protein [Candidatus Dormibacteraceae bacterium]
MAHFCVHCGHPLRPVVIEEQELEGCRSCGFVLWRDPKVVTMVVVEAEGGIALARRGLEPGYGHWCLPGGFVNQGEHPAEGAARECLEEIGARVEILDLLGVYHIRKVGAPSMVAIGYRGRIASGESLSAGPEMLEVGVFPVQRLPGLAFPSHAEAMLDWSAKRESAG